MRAVSLATYVDNGETKYATVRLVVTSGNIEVFVDDVKITPDEWHKRGLRVYRFTDPEYENLVRWADRAERENHDQK